MADVAHRLVVHGHVQGVWFRAEMRDEATRLGVAGWVRNRMDGTVEAHVEGESAAVEELLAWVRAGGPPRAHVTGVEVRDVEVTGATAFTVTR